MRTIKFKLLTQTKLEVVETAASTFGELKSELSYLGIDWSSTKLIDKASKASFEVDEAILPAIACIMFVMPTKSKAGAELSYREVKSLIKDFKDNGGNVPFNYTQATTQKLNDFWNSIEKTQAIVEDIQEEMIDSESEVITLSPGTYTVVVEGNEEVSEEVTLVDETTEEDLNVEASRLKELFKQ